MTVTSHDSQSVAHHASPAGPLVFRPFQWVLDAGRDLFAHPLASLAYGVLVVALGILVLAYQQHPLYIAAAVLGFLLVGPVFAAGCCELSRRRERGEAVDFGGSLEVLTRCRQPLLHLAAGLLAVAAAWFALALGVLYWSHGSVAPSIESTVWGNVLAQLSPLQILVYAGSALGLALVTFTMTVISVPMIIDRNVSAGSAVRASLDLCRNHPLVMLTWAVVVCVLVLIGVASWLVGLVVIFPLLGHATWRAYDELGRQES